jgi:hypothetical protein
MHAFLLLLAPDPEAIAKYSAGAAAAVVGAGGILLSWLKERRQERRDEAKEKRAESQREEELRRLEREHALLTTQSTAAAGGHRSGAHPLLTVDECAETVKQVGARLEAKIQEALVQSRENHRESLALGQSTHKKLDVVLEGQRDIAETATGIAKDVAIIRDRGER